MASWIFGALGAAAFVSVLAPPAFAQSAEGIPGVIAPGTATELVQEGFQFTEGPVATLDGGLYFTDIRANRIHLLDAAGKITIAHENTNGANGLMLTKEGDLLAAEGAGKRISKRSRAGAVVTLADSFDGRPYLAPNDLYPDAKGGIYFTDPGPRPVVPGRPTFVFYLPPGAKEPILADDKVARPNGLILTLDGKTLLVADTIGDTVFAYDVEANGGLKNKRPFAQIRDIPAGKESGGDGIALDRDGRLYVTAFNGVQVFDAKGQYLGTIKVARQPTNVAFAGSDRRTLYITAREGLYRIKTLAQGADRIGK